MRRFVAALAVLAAAATACSSVVDGQQVAPGPSYSPLTKTWSSPVESGQGDQTLVGGAADGTRVYVSDLTGHVWALDEKTGKIDWSRQVGRSTGTAVAVAGGKVWLYDTNTGLYVLDPATGSTLWRIPRGVTVDDPFLPAVAHGGYLYYGDDGPISAAVATGHKIWSRSAEFTASPERFYDSSTDPATDGTDFFVQTYYEDPTGQRSEQLVALSASTGRTEWSVPVPDNLQVKLYAAGGRVLRSVQNPKGTSESLTSFDARTGRSGWSATIPDPYSDHASIALGSQLLVPSTDRTWRAVTLSTGRITTFDQGGAEVGNCAGRPCVLDYQLYVFDPFGTTLQTIGVPKPDTVANLVTGPTGEVFLVGESTVSRFSP